MGLTNLRNFSVDKSNRLKRETIMNNHFVHLEYSTTHPGVARAEQAVHNVRAIGNTMTGPGSLAVLLLSAVVAALVVVADQMMDTWADGHMLAAWVALWAVAFAAVGLFAGASRHLAAKLLSSLDAWSANLAQRRADARLWAIAQTDARLMAELQGAMNRGDAHLAELTPAQAHAANIIRERLNYV